MPPTKIANISAFRGDRSPHGEPQLHLAGSALVVRWACRIVFSLISLVLQWRLRYQLSGDTISYLDIGDAYFHGDLHQAINAYWSPLYSWILGAALRITSPGIRLELPIVHAVLFLLSIVAALSFEYFWKRLALATKVVDVPSWWITGYVLLSACVFLLLENSGPDYLVFATWCWIAGMLLQIKTTSATTKLLVALGLLLGVGYLAKTVMFVLAFGILAVLGFVLSDKPRARLKQVALSLVAFLVIALPYVTLISRHQGKPTFGETGKYNFTWIVDRVPARHWTGGFGIAGQPNHGPMKLWSSPDVFLFPNFDNATYPAWYDPSYWDSGMKSVLHPKTQAELLAGNAALILSHCLFTLGLATAVCLIALITQPRGNRWPAFARLWPLWTLALLGLAVYLPLAVNPRYVAQSFLFLWASVLAGSGVFSGGRTPLARAISLALLVLFLPQILNASLRDTAEHSSSAPVEASALLRAGVHPGDRVAVIGEAMTANWARLARVHVVADIPASYDQQGWAIPFVRASVERLVHPAEDFWNAPDSTRKAVLEKLKAAGIREVVSTTKQPKLDASWTPLPGTSLSLLFLQ